MIRFVCGGLVIAVLFFFASTCISNDLSRGEATRLLKQAVKETQETIFAAEGYTSTSDPSVLEIWATLQKAGMLELTKGDSVAAYLQKTGANLADWTDPWNVYFYTIRFLPALSPYIIRRLEPTVGGSLGLNYTSVELLAWKRKFGAVTGIRRVNNGFCDAQVEFTYKYDVTPVGKLFESTVLKRLPRPTGGAACFLLYDDGWRIAKVVQ